LGEAGRARGGMRAKRAPLMPWYQAPAVWVAAAALAILGVALLGVWVGLNLGLERGERRAADKYRRQLTEAQAAVTAAWHIRRPAPIAATYTALGYPDATQAMPPADDAPDSNHTAPWTYPRGAEYGPGLLQPPEAEGQQPGP
jgi:hypothetical protein